MNKLLLVVVVLVVAKGFELTGIAKPCPPSAPSCRRPPPPPPHPPPPPPPPPPVVTTIYQRAVPAIPPTRFDRSSVERLLAGSVWTRLGSRSQIRFIEPDAEQFARPPHPIERDHLIREVAIDLIRDRRTLLVNIDGDLYTLSACQMPRPGGPRPGFVMTSCLEHRDDGGAFGGLTYGGR